jgi:predicted DNA-binding transcriptional regulator AlpA
MEHVSSDERLLDLNEVRRLIPVGRTTVWGWRKAGKFPSPVQLPGKRRVAWRASEISKWIAERPTLVHENER